MAWMFAREVERLRRELEELRERLSQAQRQTRACRLALVPNAVHEFLEQHRTVHLSAGGVGDAWLTIAMLSREDRPHLLFAANPGVEQICLRLFELFDIPTMLVAPFAASAAGMVTFYHAWEHLHCVGKCHLPPHLDYDDWALRPDAYVPRLVKWLNVREKFGCADNLRRTGRMIALAPRGGDTSRAFECKRLSHEEYHRVVARLVSADSTVVTVGSEQDLQHYGLYPHQNHVWHTSDWRISHEGGREPSSLQGLLAVINGCDEVFAVDTWLKTYSALACVPTTVIATRYDRPYQNAGDHIFLNPAWGFRLVQAEELLGGSLPGASPQAA